MGDTAGAKVDYTALREAGTDLKEVYLKEAVLHRLVFVKGGDDTNLGQAEELLSGALALDPNYFDALFELGNVYHLYYDRRDDEGAKRKVAFTRAILWYRRAMALNPRMAAPRVEWGRLCLKAVDDAVRNDELGTAHELLLRVEADAGDVAEVHKSRLRLNVRADFPKRVGFTPDAAFEGAAAALERCRQLAPDDRELPWLEAMYHRARGYSYYFTWARIPEKTHPQHKESARLLAVESFRAAYAACPQDPENAAIRDRLREIAPEVIVIDRDQAKQAHERGAKAFEANRWKDAADAFREVLLLFPESTYHRYYLALSLSRSGDREAARPLFEQVANANDAKESADACFELGNEYMLEKDDMVARVWYTRYVRLMEELGRADEPRVQRARNILIELGDAG
jgi:tetratricopeptide (TPR) repeat protein